MGVHTTLRLLLALVTYGLIPVEVVRGQPAAWPQALAIGTASPGGLYDVYGQAVAKIVSRALNLSASAQVTQGPAQNIVLLERREAMLGFITTGVGLQAWNGAEWTKGTQYRAFRAIFPMYDTAFQFAAPKRLGLRAVADLTGRRVGVGPRAGTGGTYLPEIFATLGIAADIRFGAVEQQTAQLMRGDLDAVAFAAGFPMPALAELASADAVVFPEPSQAETAAVRVRLPEISLSVVPAATYASLMQDYHTFGLFNFAVAHRDLPEDLVYAVVKAVFEHRDELERAHPAAKETLPANMSRNTLFPVHPGALRYYREIGVSIAAPAEPGN
jgi:TRAP transporter TAXI family solute receptor